MSSAFFSSRRRAGRLVNSAISYVLERLEVRQLLSTGPVADFRFDQSPAPGYMGVIDSTGNSSGNFENNTSGSDDITDSGLPSTVTGARSFTGSAWSFPRGQATPPAVDVPYQGTLSSLGNTTSTTGISIGFWVDDAFNSTDSGATLLQAGGSTLSVSAVQSGSVGQVKIVLGNNQVVATTSISSGTLDGTWHHIVLTADFTQTTNNVDLYVDGALDPTDGVTSHSFTSFNNTSSGGNNDLWLFSDRNLDNHWIGAADDLTIYNRAITASEVTMLYTQGSDAAPNTYAGGNATLPAKSPTPLNGAAFDEGNSAHPTVSNTWSQVSGPGTVTFANVAQLNTNATFPAVGTYVLQLSSSDGMYTATSTVTETVVANTAPVVTTTSAMPAVVLPTTSLSIGGTATDDGFPHGTLTTTWSVASTPPTGGSVKFANSHAINTTATFTGAGRYTLQLTASDGSLSGNSQLPIEVYPAGTGGSQIVVNAGGTHEAWMNTPVVNLSGTYWNTNKAVTAAWSVASSPAGSSVTFANASSLQTTATFSMVGVYTLKLSVTDGTLSGSSTSITQVYSDGATYGGDPLGMLNQYFTTAPSVSYDFTGFSWSSFSAPGAAYSHPRILMSASDIPSLVNRLYNTSEGQIAFATIQGSVNGSLESSTSSYYQIYNDLASGVTTSYIAAGAGTQDQVIAALSYDAFDQMVLYNAAANGSTAQTAAAAEGAKVGAALATLSAWAYTQMVATANIDFQNWNINYTSREMLGLAYDYDYNLMSAAQQNTVRGALIEATSNQWILGQDTIPSYDSNTSNWIPMVNSALLTDICAVEGETFTDTSGVQHTTDPAAYPRVEAALQKFFAIGVFPDGSLFEGMGKGLMYSYAEVELAKRGDFLIASTNARYNVEQVYMSQMEPYGYTYTWDEYLGGSDMAAKAFDVPVMKWAFPNDPVIDFQYRNYLGPDYSNINLGSGKPNFGFSITSAELMDDAVFAIDYNKSLTYAQGYAAAGAASSLSYFSNNRGLLVARSDWTTNASQLYFQPRSEWGGHHVPDRDTFTYSALGKNWVPYVGDIADSTNASTVSVDGAGSNIIAAQVTSYTNTALSSFMTGNATLSYSTEFGGTSAPATFTNNQFLLNPDLPAWGNLPASQLPQWDTNGKLSGDTWTLGTPFVKAYRTAGLVRGTDPYALITDDIQEDSNSHTYSWNMAVANDVTVYTPPPTAADPFYDVILTDNGNGSSLLVRFLKFNGSTPTISLSGTQAGFTFNYKMLRVSTTSVAPNFKVMLYAFKTGTALPTTTWNGNTLTIKAADGQTDQVLYTPSTSNGATTVTVNRLDNASALTVPVVSIAPTNPNADAGSLSTGSFTVSRTGSTTSALIVRYTVGGTAIPGTDYVALPGSVTIPAGQSSAVITITPISPSGFKSAATVSVKLSASTLYSVGQIYNVCTVATIAGAHAAASAAMGSFTSVNIGGSSVTGNITLSNSVFTATGNGSGIRGSSDQFQFDYQTLAGDGDLIARIDSLSANGDTGLMIRNDLTDTGAQFAFVGIDNGGTVHFMFRNASGGATNVNTNAVGFSIPIWVKLVRSGDTFSGYYSHDGAGWVLIYSTTLTIATPAYAGIALSSSTSGTSNTTLVSSNLDEVSINGDGVNASPTVTVTGTFNASQSTPVVSGEFIVTRDDSIGDLIVHYTVTGTAVAGTDYTALPGTVIIPDGQNVVIIPVTPIGSAAAGANKTVIFTPTAVTGYSVGSPGSGTVNIIESGTKNAGLAPALWYSMNQTPNRTANGITDSTGDTTGTISSGTGTPTVVTGATAATGNAWYFNTSGAAITVSGTATNPFLQSLGDINRTTGLTLSFWENRLYNSSTDNNNSIFSFGKVFSASTVQDSTNHQYTNVTIGAVGVRVPYTLDGTWHHIVMSVNFKSGTNNCNVYVDGVQTIVGWYYNNAQTYSYQFADSFTDPSNPNLVIASAFKGSLDDVMVFNRALTAAEVQTIYTSSDRPTATISVGNPPINATVSSATVTFDRNVSGLTYSSFTLTRDGTNVPLTSAVTITPGSSSASSFTVNGLSTFTSTQGLYVLTLNASSSIVDPNGISLSQAASITWGYWAAPTVLTASALDSNDIQISWTNNTNAGVQPTVTVQQSTDGVTNWTTIGTVSSGASYTDSTVSDGLKYYYRVFDSNGLLQSNFSNVATAVTPLLAPSFFSITQPVDTAELDIVWIEYTANATSVTLDRSSNGGTNWTNIATLTPGTDYYPDTGVSVGGSYEYRLQMVNAIVTSSYVISVPTTVVGNFSPTVAVAAAAGANPVTGTTVGLTVLGADPDGESNLTYTWTATSLPPGATAPTYSINTTNAAKNTVATFYTFGNYTFQVTITNSFGLSVTSSTSVLVNQTLSIQISPTAPATVNSGASQQYTAVISDQFNNVFTPTSPIVWSTTGDSNSIVQSGLESGTFIAGTTAGTFSVTASYGSVSSSTSVIVGSGVSSIPSLPVLISVVANADHSVTLTWSDSATDVFGFVISMLANGSTAPKQMSMAAGSTSVTLAPLVAGTNYTFKVRAMNSTGLTGWSNSILTTA